MTYDVSVVGTGPNGLAAACVFAAAGLRVHLIEAHHEVGGGARTSELITPGVRHDMCSAVHPMASVSPFFHALGLWSGSDSAVAFRNPTVQFAHAITPEHAGVVFADVARTADALAPGPAGQPARRVWRKVFDPLLDRMGEVASGVLGDPRVVPRNPLPLAAFGTSFAKAMRCASQAVRWHDNTMAATFAGAAAHAVTTPGRPGAVAAGLLLTALAQTVGWPIPQGGSRTLVDAMMSRLRASGADVTTGFRVTDLAQVPKSHAVVFDTSARDLLAICGHRASERYRRQLNSFQYGAGAFKVDCVATEPIPWRNPLLKQAGTVHIGGSVDDVTAAEHAVGQGRFAEEPFVLLSQPSVVDDSRAPVGQHPIWLYAHVPFGSERNITDQVLARVEHYAPGFRDTLIATSSHSAMALSQYNANYVGGDIGAGAATMAQIIARPALRWDPYRTPVPGVYLCSSATPPGPGVHGMSGVHAARRVLIDRFGVRDDPLDLVANWQTKPTADQV